MLKTIATWLIPAVATLPLISAKADSCGYAKDGNPTTITGVDTDAVASDHP
jgi:hypothetical protein